MEPPWEHPDWYDLHDTAWTAGSEREPEHYRELVIALPPLGEGDHLVDIGTGTGKLARVIARAYPEIGRVTLIEPNEVKLRRARAKMAEDLPRARVEAVAAGVGRGQLGRSGDATLATFGSVLMPMLELGGGTFADGMAWVDRSLAEAAALLRPGAWLYALETLVNAFAQPVTEGPARRLFLPELAERFSSAGLQRVECVYRFRDRVILRGQRP
jgi:SAM-dependent methyltransferase